MNMVGQKAEKTFYCTGLARVKISQKVLGLALLIVVARCRRAKRHLEMCYSSFVCLHVRVCLSVCPSVCHISTLCLMSFSRRIITVHSSDVISANHRGL